MASVHVETTVDAPRERVFDLARSVDAHVATMDHTGERAVDGVTEGLLDAGDRVTFRARHFGVTMELSAEITAFDRPAHFRDAQIAGPFAWLEHDHRFEALAEGRTRMIDEVRFGSPLGPVGRVVDALVLRRYVARLVRRRGEALRDLAGSESDEWQRHLG